MTLSLTQSVTAIGPNVPAFFVAVGGTEPYIYSVLPDGAGGSIDAATGQYTGPASASSDPSLSSDTIQVTDALSATATATILVSFPLMLLCEILWREMSLDPSRVYLWDQKILQPTDSGIYVAVSVLRSKPFANVNRPASTDAGMDEQQYVSVLDVIGIDIVSRGPAARDRRYDVLLALGSTYAQRQQEINSFRIGRLPAGTQFINLSYLDGAAIPYRFHIDINLQYAYAKAKPIQYFDTFQTPQILKSP